jgi:hypothetical protein
VFTRVEDGQHAEEGAAGPLLNQLEVGSAEFDLVSVVRRSPS